LELLTTSVYGVEELDMFPATGDIFLWYRNKINIKLLNSMAKEYETATLGKRGRKPYCVDIRKRVTFYLDQSAIACLGEIFNDISRSAFVSHCIKKEILGEDYEQ
jgi:hypothetical protein